MRKSILALTVVLVAGSFAQASTANAQGGRSGFGVAFSPVFGRHSGADPSILNQAEQTRQQARARARADYAHERRREAAAVMAAARAARATKAARVQQAAAERRRDAAVLTAQKQVQRQRVTVKPVKPAQVVKAPVAVPTATAASLAAPALEAGSIQAARPAAGGECKRFIPAAGVTITVPCTE